MKLFDRTLSVALSLTLLLGLVCLTPALATSVTPRTTVLDLSKSHTVTWSGESTGGNPAVSDLDATLTEGWKWEYVSKTLTLGGADIAVPSPQEGVSGQALILPSGATIVLEGTENKVSGTDTAIGTGGALSTDPDALTIRGSGTLTVESRENAGGHSGYAIAGGGEFESPKNVVIEDCTLVLRDGGTAGRGIAGIDNAWGDVILTNATVTAENYRSAINTPGGGCTATASNLTILSSTRGINAGEGCVSITGGTVDAVCTTDTNLSEPTYPVAIASGSTTPGTTSITIDGSRVTATSNGECAIFTPGTVDVKAGSDVTVTGKWAAIQAGNRQNVGGITISGKVNATSTDDSGIYTTGALTIAAGADVTAVGNTYCGLNAGGNMSIDGKVVAEGPNDCAIFTKGTLTIGAGADVTAVTSKFAALRANGDIVIGGGKVTAASSENEGIWPDGTLTISGADVTAAGTPAIRVLPDLSGYTDSVVILGSTTDKLGGDAATVDALNNENINEFKYLKLSLPTPPPTPTPPPYNPAPPSNTTTETTKHPDGSTTTTVTNKKTGAVTETTKAPDGTVSVVETKKDGSMAATETRKDGTKVISATTPEGKTTATVTAPERATSVTVTIPTPEKPAPGVVAVVVKADGTREVVKTSASTERGLRLTLPYGATLELVNNSKSFDDVAEGAPYADAVAFVTSRELFVGTATDAFTPEAPMTRAMIWTVLARLDGHDTAAQGVWYTSAQTWSRERGLSDGSDPDGVLTREQLLTILYRYAGSPAVDGDLSDNSGVSPFAADAVVWAMAQGILPDNPDAPTSLLTRAGTAALLERFIQIAI